MRAPRKALLIALILLVAFLQSPLAIIPLAQCAEGDYVGVWDLKAPENDNPIGITTDGTNIWVVDYSDDKVYKYNMVGGYVDVWNLEGVNTYPYGITTDGSNIWVVDRSVEAVYKYNMAGVYIGVWSTTGANSEPFGIATDGANIWILDMITENVYKYNMAGVYIGVWSTTGANSDPRGMTTDGVNIWIVDIVADSVYKYDMDGGYIGVWSLKAPENADARSLTTDGINFWVVDHIDDKVYKYEGPPVPPEYIIENEGIIASDSTVDDEQWFFLNASIEVLQNSSTFLFNRIDIDPDGLNMSCSYTNSTDTFIEENDPNNYLQLDVAVSVKTDLNNTFVRVDYYLRIHSNVTKDGVYNVTVYSTASGDLSDSDNYTSVFTLTIRTPSAPTLLFGAGFNSTSPYVELHWTHDMLIFTWFAVQNSTDKMSWGHRGTNTTREFTDETVVNGTERYYRVRACRYTGVGWKYSTWSDINFETVYFIKDVEVVEDVTVFMGAAGVFWIIGIILVPIVAYMMKKG